MDKEKNITNDPTRIYSDRKVETKTGNLSEPFRVSNDRKKQCCRSQDLRWKELRGPGGAPPFKPPIESGHDLQSFNERIHTFKDDRNYDDMKKLETDICCSFAKRYYRLTQISSSMGSIYTCF